MDVGLSSTGLRPGTERSLAKQAADAAVHKEGNMSGEPSQGIVVSDLHIDSWLLQGKESEKQQPFLEFLRAIEPDIRELYVSTAIS
jgi:hypothetical protein